MHTIPVRFSFSWSWFFLVTICRDRRISVDFLNLLSVGNHITLLTCILRTTVVFTRCILRSTGLLRAWLSCSFPCTFKVKLAIKNLKLLWLKRWDKYSPSILMPFALFYLVNLDNGIFQTWRNQFGRYVIPLSGSSCDILAVLVWFLAPSAPLSTLPLPWTWTPELLGTECRLFCCSPMQRFCLTRHANPASDARGFPLGPNLSL